MFKFLMSALLTATLGGMLAVAEAKANGNRGTSAIQLPTADHWEYVYRSSDFADAEAVAASYQAQGFVTSILAQGGGYNVFIWAAN